MAVDGLAGANLLVGVLNLVPGLPLDGGRVLKAAVWGATGNVHRGTVVAGVGRPGDRRPGAAAAAGRCPAPTCVTLLLCFVVATFLWTGSTAAITSARLRQRLPRLVARDLARRTLAVPGDLPLVEAVRRAQDAQAGGIVTVTTAGCPGRTGQRGRRSSRSPRTAGRGWPPRPWPASLDEGLRLPVTISGEELVQAITRTPAAEYLLVEEDGSVFGVLSTADVDRAFRETTA